MAEQVIPDAAVEAATLKLARLNSDSGDQLTDAEWAREILESAAQHMGEMEWAVFRASDGEDGTPVEGFRYPSREAAQKSINSGYTQPQFWEPRGRVVGKWTADAV